MKYKNILTDKAVIKDGKKMKIVVFGIGRVYEKYKGQLEDLKIVAFLDNDRSKQREFFEGIRVYAPEDINDLRFDYVLLMSLECLAMRQQLIALGVDDDKIIDYTDIYRIGSFGHTKISYCKALEIRGKIVLLITHELSNTGAPVVLFYMAKILKKEGFQPVIISPLDGRLREDIVEAGIPVIIDINMSPDNPVISFLLNQTEIVILNTIALKSLVTQYQKKCHWVMWWLHEADSGYCSNNIFNLKAFLGQNVYVYAVSRMARDAFLRHGGSENTGCLAYGIEDRYHGRRELVVDKSKIIFAIIGTVCHRKAQDVFIDAISRLKIQNREKAEFWIIGKEQKCSFTLNLRKRCSGISEIIFWGERSLDEIDKMYEQIDVVVCPSREDPMPVVVAEGMMFGKVCIVSDMTGESEYITEMEDGLICKAGDCDSLRLQLIWAIEHKEKLDRICKNSRKLYKKIFSEKAFIKNMNDIIKQNMELYSSGQNRVSDDYENIS